MWKRTVSGVQRIQCIHTHLHLCLKERAIEEDRIQGVGEGDREQSSDLQPGYLQREREGKQERPWGDCPVEGQTAVRKRILHTHTQTDGISLQKRTQLQNTDIES